MNLREELIKLAHGNPGEIREALLPLLREGAAPIDKFKPGEIFSDYRKLGSEAIERVRGMDELATMASSALRGADRRFLSQLGPVVDLALETKRQVDLWLRGANAKALTKSDVREAQDFVQKTLTDRIKLRLKEVTEEAKRYKLASPEWVRVFDKLKSGQTIKVALTTPVSRSGLFDGEFHDFKVGRRSMSKKHGVESITLQPVWVPKARGAQVRLMKRDGKISVAVGDMAGKLEGIKLASVEKRPHPLGSRESGRASGCSSLLKRAETELKLKSNEVFAKATSHRAFQNVKRLLGRKPQTYNRPLSYAKRPPAAHYHFVVTKDEFEVIYSLPGVSKARVIGEWVTPFSW